MSSSVLPEPAGACTMKERDGSSARARIALSLIGVLLRAAGGLGDAAEHVQMARAATLAGLARIGIGAPRQVFGGKRFQHRAPARGQLAHDGWLGAGHLDALGVAEELAVTRLHAREQHARKLIANAGGVERKLGFGGT